MDRDKFIEFARKHLAFREDDAVIDSSEFLDPLIFGFGTPYNPLSKAISIASRLAARPRHIIINGPVGSGKKTWATVIHEASPWRYKILKAFACNRLSKADQTI